LDILTSTEKFEVQKYIPSIPFCR